MSRNLIRAVLSIAGANVVVMLLAFPLTPVLVRTLGSAQYGEYAFMLSFLGIAWVFVNGGVFDGVRKYIAEDRAGEHWQNYVFGFYFRVAILFVVPSSIVVALAAYSGLVSSILGSQFTTLFYLVGLLLIARQFRAVGRSVLMGLGNEHLSEPLMIAEKFVFWPVAIGLAAAGVGVAGVLIGHIAAAFLTAVAAFMLLSRSLSLSSVFHRTPSDFPRRTLLGFNNQTIVLMFLLNSLLYTDILLLQPIAGSDQAGYYQAALVVAEFLWVVPIAAQTALLHTSSELWSSDRQERITRMSATVTRYVFLVTMLLSVGIAVLADSFVPLYYGPDFEASITPLRLLLVGVVGYSVARPILAIGQGKGALRALIYATGGAVTLNLLLNVILIPLYGMRGAAVATSIGYGSMLVFHVWCARRIGFEPLSDLRVWRILAAALVTTIVIYPLDAVIASNLLSLLVVPPTGFVVYVGTALAVGALDHDDIDDLRKRTPDRVVKMFS